MAGLDTVALDQKRWSLTANVLKRGVDGARLLTLGLTVLGAILETGAAQLHVDLPKTSEVAGYAGAAALAVVVVIRSQSLARDRLQAWIVARAASESFKREMYYYRTSAGPYNPASGGNPEVTLFERRDEILGKVRSVQKYAVEPDPRTLSPLAVLDANAYTAERVTNQIDWFRRRADQNSTTQGSWQNLEYALSVIGALLGAGLTFTHNQTFGAWIAVITTISGAVAAHVLASRYEQLTVSYRATADRLTGILGRWRGNRGTLAELVEPVEAALREENQSWIAGADELLKDVAAIPAKQASERPTSPTPASS